MFCCYYRLSGWQKVQEVIARVAEPNKGSARLLERLGFECKGRHYTGLELAKEPVADWIYHKPIIGVDTNSSNDNGLQ